MASFASIRLIDERRRRYAVQRVLEAPEGMIVDIREPTRSLDQNAKIWAMIGDIRKAKPGGRVATADEWKSAIMQSFNQETDRKANVIADLDGVAFEVNTHSTSSLSKRTFAELIEFIYAWFAPFEIQWSEPYRDQ